MEATIIKELTAIKNYTLLGAKNVLTLSDVALITGLSKAHLYSLTCRNKIPYYKPMGKQIYFKRSEVEDWLLRNRYNTQEEAETGAVTYVIQKGGVR